MITKYTIQYAVPFARGGNPTSEYHTDDPVACESFLTTLLESGLRIHEVRHEGVPLPQKESDRMIKAAAGVLAAQHVARSLGLKGEEVHYRFGFAA